MTAADEYKQWLTEVVATFPPLTPEQRDRVRVLFAPTVRTRRVQAEQRGAR